MEAKWLQFATLACVLALASAQLSYAPADFETRPLAALGGDAPVLAHRPLRSRDIPAPRQRAQRQRALSPGYIEEGATVRAHTTAGVRALTQVQAFKAVTKVGYAFLQTLASSFDEEDEQPRASLHQQSIVRRRTRDRQGARALFHPFTNRRERGRVPSRVEAGFVGLELESSVHRPAVLPAAHLVAAADPVTIEVEVAAKAATPQQPVLERLTLMQDPAAAARAQPQPAAAAPAVTRDDLRALAAPAVEPRFLEQQQRVHAAPAFEEDVTAPARETRELPRFQQQGVLAETGDSATLDAAAGARTGLFGNMVTWVKGLFKKRGGASRGRGGGGGAKKKKEVDARKEAQKAEDCCGCRMVWGQVEMDVGNARYIEDVQASFEHNCMDAQKSSIFYAVCEDMYDDMYALTDDYMANKYPVSKMCARGKFC